jgi:hypothetical protein
VIRIKNDQQPVPAAVRKFTNGTSV